MVAAPSPRPLSRAIVGVGSGGWSAAAVLAALLIWGWFSWPVLVGDQTFFYRDLFNLFVPLETFGAEQLAAGRIPATNPTWGLGQPYRGNPNASAFYPTNLLYLVLPFWAAFNLHLVIHWLLAGYAMAALSRELGQGLDGARLAGITYAGSGWMLSALSFHNIVAIAAWWPLALLGAHRGGRRGVAIGGLAMGLGFLAGEPVTAALGTIPVGLIALRRHGWRRGLGVAMALGGLALLVALPQIVATVRVIPYSFRGTHGVLASQAGHFAVHPLRWLELLLPLPFAPAAMVPEAGTLGRRALPHLPLFLSFHPGVIAGVLAWLGWRRRPVWGLVAVAGLGLAWGGAGVPGAGRLLRTLTLGLFRSPEKAIFWLALALPLLAAAGLERLSGPRPPRGVAATFLGLGVGLLLVAGWAPRPWTVAVAGLLLLLAAIAVRGRRPDLLVPLQLVALLALAPLLLRDQLAPYQEPSPWRQSLAPRASTLVVESTYPPWRVDSPLPALHPPALDARWRAFNLAPTPGVRHGLTYPLAPDLDGLHHRFYEHLLVRLAGDDWAARLAWCRKLGVEAIVSPEPIAVRGLEPLTTAERPGGRAYLYGLDGASPAAWWPSRLESGESPNAVYEAVATQSDPTQVAWIPWPVEHTAGARVREVGSAPDRIELEVDGGGGLLVVRRAFQPLWRAEIREAGRDAPGPDAAVIPTDLVLLGVQVPAGRWRVVLEVDSRPEAVAATISLLTMLILGLAGWRRSRVLARLRGQDLVQPLAPGPLDPP